MSDWRQIYEGLHSPTPASKVHATVLHTTVALP